LVKHLLQEDKVNDYVLFLDKHASKRIRQEIIGANPRVTIRNFPFQALGRCLPFIYSHMVISAMFEKARLDLLHAPANALPLFFRRPTVVTVHDLAIYDHPEWFPSKYQGALSFSERVIVPYSVKKARRVIAVSRQTKEDLKRIFKIPEKKIDVIYEGAEPSAVAGAGAGEDALKKLRLTKGKYVLYLGNVEPRKNIAAAVRAFVAVVGRDFPKYRDLDLIIAGRRGWHSSPVFEAMAEGNSDLAAAAVKSGLEPREQIRYVGYLAHDDKPAVLGGAAAFIFPSFYEGFGLPVIEAMSLGVPVLAAKRASLPEICGDAAVLVDPDSDEDIAAALKKILDDDGFSAELRARSLKRAAGFSWRRTALETIRTYEKALGLDA
jgi:glycosyltransferase involved in cell wall biosynthesis